MTNAIFPRSRRFERFGEVLRRVLGGLTTEKNSRGADDATIKEGARPDGEPVGLPALGEGNRRQGEGAQAKRIEGSSARPRCADTGAGPLLHAHSPAPVFASSVKKATTWSYAAFSAGHSSI